MVEQPKTPKPTLVDAIALDEGSADYVEVAALDNGRVQLTLFSLPENANGEIDVPSETLMFTPGAGFELAEMIHRTSAHAATTELLSND